MKEFLVVVASLLAVAGNVPYLRDIYLKKIEPHIYTWLLWSIVSCIVFFGALQKGAGIGAVPILASEIFTILIFLYALWNGLRRGFKHITKTDTIFLTVALLALVPWYLTQDPTISVIIAVFIDLVAFVPTMRKTFFHPASENSALYITNTLRHILILFTVDAYNIATCLHSVAMIITNSYMAYLISVHPKICKVIHKNKSKWI